jgi:hypothetical protein
MKNKLFIGIIILTFLALGIGVLANSKEVTLNRQYNSYGDSTAEKKLAYDQQKAKYDKVREEMEEKEKELRDAWSEEQEAQDDVRCELAKLKLLNLYKINQVDFELRNVIQEYCDELPAWFDDYNWIWDMMVDLDNTNRDAPPQ